MTRPRDAGFGMARRLRSVSAISEHGARTLARNIERYWSAQGYHPSSVGVQVVRDDEAEAFWIRSKLRNGVPVGKPVKVGKKEPEFMRRG